MNCQVTITQTEFDELKDSEAIVVQEWERDGERFGRVVGHGTNEEMEELVHTPGLQIVPNGLKYIGLTKVAVSELIQ
jgi:hypothetical protein